MKSKLLLSAIGFLFTCVSFTGSANADLIPFDLSDPSGVAGTAGEALESTGSVTLGGVTINVGAASSIPTSTGAEFSAVTAGAGINTDGVTSAGGDGASVLDLGETLTFTFTFGSETVSLNEIDFSGVGGNDGVGDVDGVVSAGDAALVNVASSSFSLFTGVTDFNGNTQAFSPDGGIALASGDTIVISAEEAIVIQGITLHVTPAAAVPEPSTFAVLGIGCVAGLMRRRRVTAK